MSFIFSETYPWTLLMLLDSAVMQITHCVFLLFCDRLKWIMPAISLNSAPLLRWAVGCRTFSKRIDRTVLKIFFCVCVWNAPKMDEQENPALSTDCELPTRSKKVLIYRTSKSLSVVAWAQLTLLWCTCGTVTVPVPQSTHCPLVSMKKCSAVYIRSGESALVCLPGDFWLAWHLSLGIWWLLNNLVLHSSCLFKRAFVSFVVPQRWQL